MKPVPLQPNLPTPTTAFGNPAPIAQYYICPHCKKQSPLIKEWVGLTDEERNNLWRDVIGWGDPSHDDEDLMKAIEAKLKEKNT